MRCIIDHKNKVNLFWTEKCGCTFIKQIYSYYVRGLERDVDPHDELYEMTEYMEGYTNILVVRNPYHRLISGFLHRFVAGPESAKLKFQDFKEFLESDFRTIDYDHFAPQFARAYNDSLKFDFVYDLDGLDIFNGSNGFLRHFEHKPIDPSISFKNNHTNQTRSKLCMPNAHKLPYRRLCMLKKMGFVPQYCDFIDPEVKIKIDDLYHEDFVCLANLGFHYEP